METRERSHRYVQELRWDPILGEWVMVSNIRELRPWRPSTECPFCPGGPETGYGWETIVLENKYPMLSMKPPPHTRHYFYRVAPGKGKCLVLVETPRHDVDDLSDLGYETIAKVFSEIRELTAKYAKERWAIYLFYFRNKGREIGVSLTHPHSQIYVTPFIPAKISRELENSRKYYKRKGRCLFCDIINVEAGEKTRLIEANNEWAAFIPFFAHWPFEVHIYPRRHVQLITQLSSQEIVSLAKVVGRILCGFKKVFDKPMPYIMVLHQAPLKGRFPYYHLHLEIYGVYRVSGRLKYAAGMETGGGNFTYDTLPENAAEVLAKAINKYCK